MGSSVLFAVFIAALVVFWPNDRVQALLPRTWQRVVVGVLWGAVTFAALFAWDSLVGDDMASTSERVHQSGAAHNTERTHSS